MSSVTVELLSFAADIKLLTALISSTMTRMLLENTSIRPIILKIRTTLSPIKISVKNDKHKTILVFSIKN